MKQRIHKLFWAWEFEKEELWLNECAQNGLALTDIGFCRYDFEPCEPGEYQYRLEFLEHYPTHEKSREYIKFMEESGAQYIGSYFRWVYFRKKIKDGSFNLYSDVDSQIAHFQRIRSLLLFLTGLEFFVVAFNLILGFTTPSPENIGICIPNVILMVFIGGGYLLFTRTVNRLKKERVLHE